LDLFREQIFHVFDFRNDTPCFVPMGVMTYRLLDRLPAEDCSLLFEMMLK
jgi:hypothetical protein